MNVSWVFDWWSTMVEIENLYSEYYAVTSDSFFDPENPDPLKGTMWLAREEYLNVCVDLVRDLLWHNLEGRYDNATN